MRRFSFIRHAAICIGLGAGFVALQPQAHAERVISDLEATKLTFAALTATPPVHHFSPSRHQVASSRLHTKVAHAAPAHSIVHLVSYHKTSHAMVHGSSHHHRT